MTRLTPGFFVYRFNIRFQTVVNSCCKWQILSRAVVRRYSFRFLASGVGTASIDGSPKLSHLATAISMRDIAVSGVVALRIVEAVS